MILFSDRMELESAYREWLTETWQKGNHPSDCALNVIGFLAGKKLLHETRVKELLAERKVEIEPE